MTAVACAVRGQRSGILTIYLSHTRSLSPSHSNTHTPHTHTLSVTPPFPTLLIPLYIKVRVLLSLEFYPDDAQLAGIVTGIGSGGSGGGGSAELPVPSVLLARRGVVATAACQALTSMLTLATSSSLSSPSASSSSATAPTLASLIGWSPQGCGSVVDVLRICVGDTNATTAALTTLVSDHIPTQFLHFFSIPTPLLYQSMIYTNTTS